MVTKVRVPNLLKKKKSLTSGCHKPRYLGAVEELQLALCWRVGNAREPDCVCWAQASGVVGESPTLDGGRCRRTDSAGSSPPRWICGACELESLNWSDGGLGGGGSIEWDPIGLTNVVSQTAF